MARFEPFQPGIYTVRTHHFKNVKEQPANPKLAIANPKFRCPTPGWCPNSENRNPFPSPPTITNSVIFVNNKTYFVYQAQGRPYTPKKDLRGPIVVG
jgi:hypothetical protein